MRSARWRITSRKRGGLALHPAGVSGAGGSRGRLSAGSGSASAWHGKTLKAQRKHHLS